MTKIKLDGVREYQEEMPVYLIESSEGYYNGIGNPLIIIEAYNEAGCNCVHLDLLDLINWVKHNRPGYLDD